MQSSGIAGGEFTSTSILLSVSRRKFYEAVPGVTVNLFLYFAKMKSPDAASHFSYLFVTVLLLQTKFGHSCTKSTLRSLHFNKVWKGL